MNKKLFIVLAAIGIIILLGGGFFLFKLIFPLKPPQTQPLSIPKRHIVTYNGFIFDPTPLVIKAADTVDFINKSDSSLWILGAPHAIHIGVTEFDAKRIYGRDEVYSYTITKKGVFGYHNHLNPEHQGAIVAE